MHDRKVGGTLLLLLQCGLELLQLLALAGLSQQRLRLRRLLLLGQIVDLSAKLLDKCSFLSLLLLQGERVASLSLKALLDFHLVLEELSLFGFELALVSLELLLEGGKPLLKLSDFGSLAGNYLHLLTCLLLQSEDLLVLFR